MNNPTENDDSIVISCSVCNGVVFWAVNNPGVMDKQMRKEVGAICSKPNRTLQHMTVAESRKLTFRCRCLPKRTQQTQRDLSEVPDYNSQI